MLSREIDGTAFRLIGAGVSALKPGAEADDQICSTAARSCRARNG
jgi:hypothetical protein